MHMGWLDSLFNTSSDAQDSGKSPGSGWLGPIAGGPPPLPPLPAPQGGSLLDHLVAGATNLTTGGNPLAGLLNAVNGLATGQRTDARGWRSRAPCARRSAPPACPTRSRLPQR